jgi:predicted DNA repair protein MutK
VLRGAEKIHHRLAHHDDGSHDLPASALGRSRRSRPWRERSAPTSSSPGEIIVIALKDVLDRGFVSRAIILVIVRHPDHGRRVRRGRPDREDGRCRPQDGPVGRPAAQRIGRGLVTGMPKLLAVLSVVGTAAWSGSAGTSCSSAPTSSDGTAPTTWCTASRTRSTTVAGVGGVLGWLVNTLASAIVGLAVGALVVVAVTRLKALRPRKPAAAPH